MKGEPLKVCLLALTVFGLGTLCSRAQITNSVAVSGLTTYSISGTNNPTLTLFRGVLYVFNVNAIGHPFFIKTNFSEGTGNQYADGVTNNGAQTGSLFFHVPADAPGQLFYNCSVHSSSGMRGTLNISNSPAPPTGEIILITISPTGVTMQSLGATNWTAIPEFSSNLTSGVWGTVPNYTNTFANGTNTTTFNRLDAICGPEVFLRVRNRFP